MFLGVIFVHHFTDMHVCSGKLMRLEIGNNSISAKGAFHVAEYVKKNKSLLLLNISMNDIGDEVLIFQICWSLLLDRTANLILVDWNSAAAL